MRAIVIWKHLLKVFLLNINNRFWVPGSGLREEFKKSNPHSLVPST